MGRPKKYTDVWIKKLAAKLIKYAKAADLPLKQEFAYQNNFASQRISEFCKNSVIFSEAIKRFEDISVAKWILAKGLPSAEKIFTLKNIAGWKDIFEHTGEIKGGNKVVVIVQEKNGNQSQEGRVPSRVSVLQE